MSLVNKMLLQLFYYPFWKVYEYKIIYKVNFKNLMKLTNFLTLNKTKISQFKLLSIYTFANKRKILCNKYKKTFKRNNMHDYYVVVVTHNSYVHIADVKLESATNKKKTPFLCSCCVFRCCCCFISRSWSRIVNRLVHQSV